MWAVSSITTKKHRYSRLRELRQKPDSGPANSNKQLAAEVLPVEYGPLPHWPIPRMGGEEAHCYMVSSLGVRSSLTRRAEALNVGGK